MFQSRDRKGAVAACAYPSSRRNRSLAVAALKKRRVQIEIK